MYFSLVDTSNSVVQDGNGEKKAENCQSMEKQIDGLPVQMAPVVPAAVGEDEMLPNDLDSLPVEFNCLSEDGLDHKPGTNALVRGPLNYSVSGDDQKRAMESTSESVPNSFKITPTMLEGSNADIKIKVMKEVRKPGRSKLFGFLYFSSLYYMWCEREDFPWKEAAIFSIHTTSDSD